jgi:hypothetical protein
MGTKTALALLGGGLRFILTFIIFLKIAERGIARQDGFRPNNRQTGSNSVFGLPEPSKPKSWIRDELPTIRPERTMRMLLIQRRVRLCVANEFYQVGTNEGLDREFIPRIAT